MKSSAKYIILSSNLISFYVEDHYFRYNNHNYKKILRGWMV